MFYAITGIGWGTGDTPDEALETYLRIQRRNFPHLTDEDLDEAWGFVWDPPEGTKGFFMDSALWWTFEDREPEQAQPEQRVKHIGSVPEFARIADIN